MNATTIEEIISLLISGGPVVVNFFLKIESLLNLSPDEKQNVANAIAQSNTSDQATMANVQAWMLANGFVMTFVAKAKA